MGQCVENAKKRAVKAACSNKIGCGRLPVYESVAKGSKGDLHFLQHPS